MLTFNLQTIYSSLTSHKTSVIWYHNENPANPDIHNTVRATLNGNVSLADPKRAMHFMRVVKSAAEVELMKASCEIGAQSINLAMACTRPGEKEIAYFLLASLYLTIFYCE